MTAESMTPYEAIVSKRDLRMYTAEPIADESMARMAGGAETDAYTPRQGHGRTSLHLTFRQTAPHQLSSDRHSTAEQYLRQSKCQSCPESGCQMQRAKSRIRTHLCRWMKAVPLFQEEGGALGGQLGRDRRRASHSPIPRTRAIAGSAIRVCHRRMWTSRELNEAN